MLLIAAIGLVIGISVNFRLPNLFLAAGYFLFLLVSFLIARNRQTFAQGFWFGLSFLVGIAPTLIANAINAGSPFSTTYGGADVVAPELNAGILRQYLGDAQFVLLVIAAAWTAVLWRWRGHGGTWQVALVVAANLPANLIFFMTHPLFTPYYTIPIAMLSLWTLLFTTLLGLNRAAAESPAVAQPAHA
jgi:hypothetical protein